MNKITQTMRYRQAVLECAKKHGVTKAVPYATERKRVQIDVKHVPAACLVGDVTGQKFYQYTATDEFSRFRYVEAFEECSTYSSFLFLLHMLKAFPFKVECVQTDNGGDFTNRVSIHSAISKINWSFITVDTTLFLCVLLVGCPQKTTLPFISSVSHIIDKPTAFVTAARTFR